MNQKRSSHTNFSENKKIRLGTVSEDCNDDKPKDTKNALLYLSSIFPVERFQHRLPKIVMRHQIYAFIKCRTEVDKCLNQMRKDGEVRLFRLGQKDDEIAVVYMKDYQKHLEKCSANNATVVNFLKIVEQCPDISFNKSALINSYGMKESNISELIRLGVLTSRDVGCYWLSIPSVGEFVRTLAYGRRATLQHIKRTKYKEILQSELQLRKLPPKAFLSMPYHIYDIIGSDLVLCVETSTGVVLRLQLEQTNGH